MLTRQMWLVAQLSEERAIERVEAVVGEGKSVYIADHPKRCLVLGVDVHETFAAAKAASIRYFESRIQNLKVLQDAARNQEEPA